MIPSLIMAGGKSSRMSPREKPLVKIGGLTMLERVVRAVKASNHVSKIIVVTSRHTPNTTMKAQELGLDFIVSPGRGYVDDLKFAVNSLKGPALIVNADLPLLDTAIIDSIVEEYESSKKPAMTVMANTAKLRRIGFEPQYSRKIKGRLLSPVGINILDGTRVREEEQNTMLVDDFVKVINVNSPEEIRRAEELIRDLSSRL